MTCAYCQQNPGVKSNGLWKGFLDQDTQQLVCWNCRARHYHRKSKELGHLYSEMPVLGIDIQLSLNLHKTQ
jgi:hypothetical protein